MGGGEKRAATILLFSGIERPLTYAVGEKLGAVEEGSLVAVPLRGGTAEGVVLETRPISEIDQSKFRLRPLRSLVQPEPVLTPELLKLAKWMGEYYGCGLRQIFETMIPAVVRAGKSAQEVSEIALAKDLDEAQIDELTHRAPQQKKLAQFMRSYPEAILKSALIRLAQTTPACVDALVKKGVLVQTKRELRRTAFDDDIGSAELIAATPPTLNAEQQKALDEILEDADSREFKTRLLYGVTGSGKTEVYMRAMKKVLDEGGTCIFLVPEIALTPQTVGRLKSRLGDCGLVVWHSGLSDGQRLDAWRALARGEAKVVVGARSCIFAPLKNLRLIIVDEEHDTAYKQDKAPRYNGRDIAVLRAKLCNCACLLGSATPALETLNNVKTGKYGLSRIANRIDGRKMPTVFIVDMKREKAGTAISNILKDKLAQRLENGEQAILFLNRRGYSKIFECPDCGTVEECPHCSVSMTWHKREDIIKCHLCGYTAKAPRVCRKCGSPKAKWRGTGTQKIEEAISAMFPAARIGRMDRDAMKRRDNYRKVLGDFRNGKLDILVGTQMIAKGLDFPRVTLVGIIDADISLHMPDFRAAEKTYQLIVQVAGRAGRGTADGEVIVQTLTPESAPIQYAKRDDMESFLEEELENRTEYGYPPATRLIRHIFRSRSEEKLEFYTEKWAEQIERRIGGFCTIRGPAPAPLERSEDFYRWHIWYFTPNVRAAVAEISDLHRQFPMDEDIEDVLDVDPMSMM